jgi:hypothetical protein
VLRARMREPSEPVRESSNATHRSGAAPSRAHAVK